MRTRLSLEFVLGLCITVTLLLMDKAGKLTLSIQIVLLAVMAAALIHAVSALPWVTQSPHSQKRRILLSIATLFAIIALGWWTWPAREEVTFRAFIPHAEFSYLPNTTIGGLNWSPMSTDVRVEVRSGGTPIHDLDLFIRTDASIRGVGQVSQLPGFTAIPMNDMLDEQGKGFVMGGPILLTGTDDKRNGTTQPVEPVKNGDVICATYHVHCDAVFINTTLQIVVATFRFPSGDAAKQPTQPLIPPKFVSLKGTYETSGPGGTQHHYVDLKISLNPQHF